MTRIALALALITSLGFAQDQYNSSQFIQSRSSGSQKAGITASVGFEFGSASATIDQKNNTNQFAGFGNQAQSSEYDLSMKGFNIQGTYDWYLGLGEGMGTSTTFGLSLLSSSSSDDENSNNQNNSGFAGQNQFQSQYDAKKTSIYLEQAITYNVELDGFIIQPFAALLLGVGKFTMDSKSPANSAFAFQNSGFQNLETNFFQAGATFGSNFIISDTFVPYLKGRFSKEFHSVSNFNTGSTNQGFGVQNTGNQDPKHR